MYSLKKLVYWVTFIVHSENSSKDWLGGERVSIRGIEPIAYSLFNEEQISWKQLRKHEICPNMSTNVSFKHKSVKYSLESCFT